MFTVVASICSVVTLGLLVSNLTNVIMTFGRQRHKSMHQLETTSVYMHAHNVTMHAVPATEAPAWSLGPYKEIHEI